MTNIMVKPFLVILICVLSGITYCQDSIVRVDSVYLKWFDQDKFELKLDTIKIDSNTGREYESIKKIDGCEYFYGSLNDGEPIEGRIYIYDSDGVLLKVKVFKRGRY